MPQRFSDVRPDAWYYSEIQKGACYGLLAGYEDGTYRPDTPMTRAEAGAVMVRLFERIMMITLVTNGVIITAVMLAKGK
ncbi:MAG: S-layer homology domain-containing protein [Candidatus Omnitrophota bacterium]